MIRLLKSYIHAKWLGCLLRNQQFLLKHIFIMEGGVTYFKKPCPKCQNYIDSNDIIIELQNHGKNSKKKIKFYDQ